MSRMNNNQLIDIEEQFDYDEAFDELDIDKEKIAFGLALMETFWEDIELRMKQNEEFFFAPPDNFSYMEN